ncbi:MAG: Nif3-like dinuclear metal center hexameric protein [Clostridia bacterium]|nr:Nif3-like dinuclear metal center hexameric protein [Clostridia bacterium]
MKQSEIFAVLCGYAPLELSEAFTRAEDGYDNSGIIIETQKDVKKALFALDLSAECAEYALNNGYDLVITHHPAIYTPVKRLDLMENRALTMCALGGVGVISMHLNLDIAERGTDYYFAEGLGAAKQKILTEICGGLGYGRLFEIEKTTLNAYKRRIMQTFGTENVMVYGGGKKAVSKIASFCGAGCDMKELGVAVKAGADTVASCDFKHHVIRAALDANIGVIQVAHYACENYGMKFFMNNVSDELRGVKCGYFSSDKY